MKILITGSGGMLGTDICQVLSDTGKHLIYGLDNRVLASGNDKILDGFIKADITEEKDLLKSMTGLKPELVIHTAAYTDVDSCELNKEKAEHVNALGTKNVALVCRETDSTLFYISTDYVFDGQKKEPYTEDDRLNPVNVYGRTKLAGENYIKEILKDYVVIRSSWLFGRHGSNFVEAILNKAGWKEGLIAADNKNGCMELEVVNDQTGSPTYTKDLAGAIKELTDRPLVEAESKIYHIANSGVCSWYDLACKAIECAGIKGVKVKPISTAKLNPPRPAPRPEMSALDNSRYNKLTGRLLRPWSEALKSYIIKTGVSRSYE